MGIVKKISDTLGDLWIGMSQHQVSGRIFDRYDVNRREPIVRVSIRMNGQKFDSPIDNLSYGGVGVKTLSQASIDSSCDLSLTLLDQHFEVKGIIAHQTEKYTGIKFVEKSPEFMAFVSNAVDYLKLGMGLKFEDSRTTELLIYASDTASVAFDGLDDAMNVSIKFQLDHSSYDVSLTKDSLRCATTPQGILATNVIQIGDVVDKPTLRAAIYILAGISDDKAKQSVDRAIRWALNALTR